MPSPTLCCPPNSANLALAVLIRKMSLFARFADPVHSATSLSDMTMNFRLCANRWRFVECTACHHVWLNPRPAVTTLGVIYPTHYYAYNYQKQVHPIAVKAKSWMDQSKIRMIMRSCGRRPDSYLDIGCGDGRFLRVAQRMGLNANRIFGLELDPQIVEGLSHDGFQAFCGRVEDCSQIEAGSIDLATMFHVIEHVDDPAAVVSKIGNWLSPGGILALETPNLASLDARLYKASYWGGYHIPRHWNLFRPETLRRLLEDHGLEVIRTSYQTGHSFWLYSAHHSLRFGPGRRHRLARLMHPLGGNLAALVAVTAWDKVRASFGFKTSAMLMLARRRSG